MIIENVKTKATLAIDNDELLDILLLATSAVIANDKGRDFTKTNRNLEYLKTLV